jgi:hypothetical protein
MVSRLVLAVTGPAGWDVGGAVGSGDDVAELVVVGGVVAVSVDVAAGSGVSVVGGVAVGSSGVETGRVGEGGCGVQVAVAASMVGSSSAGLVAVTSAEPSGTGESCAPASGAREACRIERIMSTTEANDVSLIMRSSILLLPSCRERCVMRNARHARRCDRDVK